MEKLLCSKDIEQIFHCSRRKAIELMRDMNPINITQKPGAKKQHLLVRESDLAAWMDVNRRKPAAPPTQTAQRGRKPHPVCTQPLPRGDIPYRIPRRKLENPRQEKSSGDVAASTGADHKIHNQYITAESGAQVQNA